MAGILIGRRPPPLAGMEKHGRIVVGKRGCKKYIFFQKYIYILGSMWYNVGNAVVDL